MKDEEMAEQFANNINGLDLTCSLLSAKDKSHAYRLGRYDGFLAGLKAGRPQWHKVADGDLPEVDNRIVLCVCVNGYIDGKRNYTLKLLTRKEFPLFQPVYAWKEIVLPELPKEIV